MTLELVEVTTAAVAPVVQQQQQLVEVATAGGGAAAAAAGVDDGAPDVIPVISQHCKQGRRKLTARTSPSCWQRSRSRTCWRVPATVVAVMEAVLRGREKQCRQAQPTYSKRCTPRRCGWLLWRHSFCHGSIEMMATGHQKELATCAQSSGHQGVIAAVEGARAWRS